MRTGRMLIIVILGILSAVNAFALDYPIKPVTVIVPYTEGSATDFIARTVGRKLSELWGQPVEVENRPGAGSTIGDGVVAKSSPDGYTLLVSSSSHTVTPALYASLPYNPKKDFAAIAPLASQPLAIFVSSNSGLNSLEELIKDAKAKPGEIKYGSPGVGSTAHLAAEKFNKAAGIDVVHVPYKGGPETIAGTIDGSVTYSSLPLGVTLKGVRAGKLIVLGVSSVNRTRELPDVPTIAEGAVSGFETTVWWGLWAPAGIPTSVKEKLAKDVSKVLGSPDVIEQLNKDGYEPMSMTPKEFSRFVRKETKDAARTAKKAGIKPQ